MYSYLFFPVPPPLYYSLSSLCIQTKRKIPHAAFPVSREEIKAIHPLSFTDKGWRVLSLPAFSSSHASKDERGGWEGGRGRDVGPGRVRGVSGGVMVGERVREGRWRGGVGVGDLSKSEEGQEKRSQARDRPLVYSGTRGAEPT